MPTGVLDVSAPGRFRNRAIVGAEPGAHRSLARGKWPVRVRRAQEESLDRLHGHATLTAAADIDVAYFDEDDSEGEHALQQRLQRGHPDLPWEVTNQAHVHTWFEAHFGHAVAPLRSLEEAVASWPEYATAVGVRLHDDGSLQVIAPHGLDDLFAMVVRRNPVRVSLDTYRQRVVQKRYVERWPRVTVMPA